MNQNLKVVGKRILVRRDKIDANGLRLPESTEKDGVKNFGTVVGIGDLTKKELKQSGLAIGQKVYFTRSFIIDTDPAETSEGELVFVEMEYIAAVEL